MTKDFLYNFIRQHKHGVLATVSADNIPESAYVGIAVTPDLKIIFDTVSDSRKYKNLLFNPNISFVIGWDNEQSVQLEGIADEPKGTELAALKRIHYAAWPDGPTRESWPGITWVRVRPRWLRFSDFNRAADVVREMTL